MRRVLPLLLAAAVACLCALPAQASTTRMVSMFDEDAGLLTDPQGTLQQLRTLGVLEVRVPVRWSKVVIARWSGYRRPPHFNAADPSSPVYDWSGYDAVVRDATADGIAVQLDLVGGAPLWATGRGAPGHANWEPNAHEFALFVRAVGTRYSGHYDPTLHRLVSGDPNDLPRVSSWSIWNEPD